MYVLAHVFIKVVNEQQMERRLQILKNHLLPASSMNYPDLKEEMSHQFIKILDLSKYDGNLKFTATIEKSLVILPITSKLVLRIQGLELKILACHFVDSIISHCSLIPPHKLPIYNLETLPSHGDRSFDSYVLRSKLLKSLEKDSFVLESFYTLKRNDQKTDFIISNHLNYLEPSILSIKEIIFGFQVRLQFGEQLSHIRLPQTLDRFYRFYIRLDDTTDNNQTVTLHQYAPNTTQEKYFDLTRGLFRYHSGYLQNREICIHFRCNGLKLHCH